MHLATVSLVVVVSVGTLDMATDDVQMCLLEDRISLFLFARSIDRSIYLLNITGTFCKISVIDE